MSTDKLVMLMFRDDGVDWAPFAGEAEGKALFQRFVDWADALEARGKLVGADPLARGGKTVRRKGASLVVDGPYAEGRESVLGYFIVRVSDDAEAVALAAESPHAQLGGAVEVRELLPFPTRK